MTCSKCIHQKVKLSMLSIILYLHFPPLLKTGDICPILVLWAPCLPSLSFPEEAPTPPLSQSSPLSGTCFLLPLYSSAIPPVLTVSNQAQQASLLQPFPMPCVKCSPGKKGGLLGGFKTQNLLKLSWSTAQGKWHSLEKNKGTSCHVT